MSEEKLIGKITHYFGKIQVAVIEISDGELNIGDEIHIKGATTDFTQQVESMEIDKEKVEKAGPGDAFGLKVSGPVRVGDQVFQVQEE